MRKMLYSRGQAVAGDPERKKESMRSPCDDFKAMVWYFQSNNEPKPIQDMLRERELHGRNRRFAERALCRME